MADTKPGPHRAAFQGLVAARTLGALADGAMLPFVVLWAQRDAHLGGAATGLLFIALAVGELTGGLAGGILADRVGHRRILLVSTAGMAMGYGSLCVVHQSWAAIAAMFVAGLFESAFHPTIAALVGTLNAGADLRKAFGVVRIGANAGRIAGPLIGAVAAARSLPAVFAVAAALLAAAFAVVTATIPSDRTRTSGSGDGHESEDTEPDHAPATLISVFRDGRLALLIAGGGLLSITFTWLEADGLVLLRQQHPLSTTGYAWLFAIAAAATVALQIPTTCWAGRLATSPALLLGATAQAVGLAMFAAAFLGYATMVAAVLVIAIGQMIYSPAVSEFVTHRAAPGRGATYQAALSTTEDIGTAIGPTSGLALGGLAHGYLVWAVAGPLCLAAGAASAVATAKPRRTRVTGSALAVEPL